MLLALAIGSLVGYGSPQVVKWLDSQVNRLFKVTPASETPAPEKKIPNLVGLTRQEAEKKLSEAGLKIGTVTDKAAGGKPVGTILEQEPRADASSSPGAAVNVTIAT